MKYLTSYQLISAICCLITAYQVQAYERDISLEPQNAKWSVQFPLPNNHQDIYHDHDLKSSSANHVNGGNLSISQDSLFDEIRDLPPLSAKSSSSEGQTTGNQASSYFNNTRWSGLAQEPAVNSYHQFYQTVEPPVKPLVKQVPLADPSQTTFLPANPGIQQIIDGAPVFDQSSYFGMSRPNIVNPIPLNLNQIAVHPLTREILQQLTNQQMREINLLSQIEPLRQSIPANQKTPGVKFVKGLGSKRKSQTKAPELERSDNFKEASSISYAPLPMFYNMRSLGEARMSKDIEDETRFRASPWDPVDSLMADSKHVPTFYSMSPYHHAMSSTKRFEKTLAVPILVGIAAALISFLIISNLFLSIPLFAMTLMQLFGGNMIAQPNNMPNNGPNNGMNGNGLTNLGGRRRKRDIMSPETEQKILETIENLKLQWW